MTNDGFSIGLIVWMIFLLGFFMLGYPALLSIFLGALAGLSSGLIAGWSQSKDIPSTSKDEAENSNSIPNKLLRWRLSRWGLTGNEPSQDTGERTGFRPRFFGPKRRRPPRPRR